VHVIRPSVVQYWRLLRPSGPSRPVLQAQPAVQSALEHNVAVQGHDAAPTQQAVLPEKATVHQTEAPFDAAGPALRKLKRE
jgi:hypothetical protein